MTPDEYLSKVESIVDISSASHNTINQLIDDLISVLPNDKKLYKYRSIDTSHYLDDLKFIYLPSVDKLNDKIDTTLNYRKANDDKDIDEFYLNNKYSVYRYFYWHNTKTLDKKRLQVVDAFINGYTELEIAQSLSSKKDEILNELDYVTNVKSDILNISYRNDVRTAFINEYKCLGRRIRNNFHVFSLSENYQQDSMWAYYCNDNRGYVVEYDFQKLKSLNEDEKKKIIYTYKVTYSNKRPPYDIKKLYSFIFSQSKDPILRAQLNISFNKQLLIKNESWKHESEWRIVLSDGTEKIYANIISSLIIDESIIEERRAIELMSYALSRNIIIKVRVLNFETLRYEYKPIKDTVFWKKVKKNLKVIKLSNN